MSRYLVSGAQEHLEYLLRFFEKEHQERLQLLARKDKAKFWKEMTSGKYSRRAKEDLSNDQLDHILKNAVTVIHFLSDDSRFDGKSNYMVSNGYNYIIAVENIIYFSLEENGFSSFKL